MYVISYMLVIQKISYSVLLILNLTLLCVVSKSSIPRLVSNQSFTVPLDKKHQKLIPLYKEQGKPLIFEAFLFSYTFVKLDIYSPINRYSIRGRIAYMVQRRWSQLSIGYHAFPSGNSLCSANKFAFNNNCIIVKIQHNSGLMSTERSEQGYALAW